MCCQLRAQGEKQESQKSCRNLLRLCAIIDMSTFVCEIIDRLQRLYVFRMILNLIIADVITHDSLPTFWFFPSKTVGVVLLLLVPN